MSEDRTFWQLVEERADATPDALCAVDDRGREIDFAGYRDAALRTAAALHGRGVGPGTPVSWMLPTTLEAMVVCAALARLGAVAGHALDHRVGAVNVDQMIARETAAFVQPVDVLRHQQVESTRPCQVGKSNVSRIW